MNTNRQIYLGVFPALLTLILLISSVNSFSQSITADASTCSVTISGSWVNDISAWDSDDRRVDLSVNDIQDSIDDAGLSTTSCGQINIILKGQISLTGGWGGTATLDFRGITDKDGNDVITNLIIDNDLDVANIETGTNDGRLTMGNYSSIRLDEDAILTITTLYSGCPRSNALINNTAFRWTSTSSIRFGNNTTYNEENDFSSMNCGGGASKDGYGPGGDKTYDFITVESFKAEMVSVIPGTPDTTLVDFSWYLDDAIIVDSAQWTLSQFTINSIRNYDDPNSWTSQELLSIYADNSSDDLYYTYTPETYDTLNDVKDSYVIDLNNHGYYLDIEIRSAESGAILDEDPSSSCTCSFQVNSYISDQAITPLPVELIFFSAKKQVNNILLTWATASETNNDYFEIQRSIDGKNYEVVGSVKGNGNSQSRIDYDFTDEFIFSGIIYYRLKQIDYNGVFEFFPLVVNGHKEDSITFRNLSGNPFNSNKLNLQVYSPIAQNVSISLIGINGTVYYDSIEAISKGTTLLTIDAKEIKRGTFVLQIATDQELQTHKLIKN
ncbi:hypothetical protein V6R21_24240 [Limibacter armeniacum]|uniref:hypothetical protein n=1 Tax=Limibacter armeniacum TaxID=466084 RepID=UPI002FE5CC52